MDEQDSPVHEGTLMALLSRLLLLAVFGFCVVLVLQPELNLAHYTPNRLMRRFGFSYQWILAYEYHLHWFLHFIVSLLLTVLLYWSAFFAGGNPRRRIRVSALIIIAVGICAELAQLIVGRGFEPIDLVFGVAGAVSAVVAVPMRSTQPRGP